MKNKILMLCVAVTALAISSCNSNDVNKIKGEWFCDNPDIVWNLEKKGEIGGNFVGEDFSWFVKNGVLYVVNNNSEITGSWKYNIEGSTLTVSPLYDLSKTLVLQRRNTGSAASNKQIGKEFTQRLLKMMYSEYNYSGMTNQTKKKNLGFYDNMFNQISSGPGYKVYQVDMENIDCGENITLNSQIYKINNKSQNVEVFIQYFTTRDAESIAQNIKTELEKKIGEKMFKNNMTIDIGEGWSVNGYQFFSMSGANSYAIAYDDTDLLFIVGLSAPSMGDFIGIPFGD